MTAEEFLIGELAQRTSISVRTIRYYISQGLLPAPDTRGRYTVYDSEYVERIKLIKRLKDAFLPIKEIRSMLEAQTRAEIEEFLRLYEAQRNPNNDALGYINNLLGHGVAEASKADRYRNPPTTPANKAPTALRRKTLPASGSSWKRVILAPGIELHIEQSKVASYDDLLQELTDQFQARLIQRAKK